MKPTNHPRLKSSCPLPSSHRLFSSSPLVGPVLNREERGRRCALCFLPTEGSGLHAYCSPSCRRKDPWGERERSNPSIPSPLVLLASRIHRRVEEERRAGRNRAAREVEELACLDHPVQARRLCSAYLGEEIAETLVGKISANAFGVADGEQVPLGLGLYPRGAALNHSCRPNCVQTFRFARGETPQLVLTLCRDVREGEEITISYIDSSQPTDRRREELRRGYRFSCQCPKCLNVALDRKTSGLACPDPACPGLPCSLCNAALQSVRAAHAKITPSQSLETVERAYLRLQTLCLPRSWYLRSAGESLLDRLLHAPCASEEDRRRALSRAASVARDVLRNAPEDPGDLRLLVLAYQRAKILLWLEPDPTRALEELGRIRGRFLVYYERDCPVVVGLDRCLAGC